MKKISEVFEEIANTDGAEFTNRVTPTGDIEFSEGGQYMGWPVTIYYLFDEEDVEEAGDDLSNLNWDEGVYYIALNECEMDYEERERAISETGAEYKSEFFSGHIIAA